MPSLQRLTISCACLFVCTCPPAVAQNVLPAVTVTAPEHTAKAKPKRKRVATAGTSVRHGGARSAARGLRAAPRPSAPASGVVGVASGIGEAQRIAAALDRARDNLSPRAGANATDIGADGIDKLPQGANQPLDKVLLQLPGVTQDSLASGAFHIRNEHANVQYRINGIMLPEGISGFGQFLETSFVGNLALLDGALARAIWPAHRRHHRHHVAQRRVRRRRRGQHLRRQSRHVHAVARIWRPCRWLELFRHRPLHHQPAGHRKSRADLQSDPRPHRARAGISPICRRTSMRHRDCPSSAAPIPENFRSRTIPARSPSFTAFGLSDFNSSAAQREPVRAQLLQRRRVPKIRRAARLPDFRLLAQQHDPLRAGHRSATYCSTATRRTCFRSSLAQGVQADAAYSWNPAHTTRFGMHRA